MKQELRIKEVCKEKGITLEDLAKRLGILRTSLSQALSRNSFSTDRLNDIATALDVPTWQLFASPADVSGSMEFLAIVRCNGELKEVTSVEELEKIVNEIKGGGNRTETYRAQKHQRERIL